MIGVATIKAKVFTDNTGNHLETPTLLLSNGVIHSLIQYQVFHRKRSISWQEVICKAVKLLLKYADANAFKNNLELFQAFSTRLTTGTIGPDGLDPSGLYRKPLRKQHAKQLISALTAYFRWIAKNYEVPPKNSVPGSSNTNLVLITIAYELNNNSSFQRKTFTAPQKRTPKLAGDARPRFPEDLFIPLLFQGFVIRKDIAHRLLRLDLRCVLITTLMHGGGLRASECFHLWVQDVQKDPLDPTKALVRIGHPQNGRVLINNGDGTKKEITREEYLFSKGFKPRNLTLGSHHAGWNNPSLDGEYFVNVFWSDPVYGKFFLDVWTIYCRQIAEVTRYHPWAFVNFDQNCGEPYTMAQFAKAHARAVRRIGLIPKKENGTTEQGHRNAYINRLLAGKVNPFIIQRVAHLQSVESLLKSVSLPTP